MLVQPHFGLENVDLIFLTAIVGICCPLRTVARRSLPTVAASLSYNFFFCRQSTPLRLRTRRTLPHSSCSRSLPWWSPILARADGAKRWAPGERVRSVQSLHAFSRKLAGAGTLDDVLWATAYQIASMLKVRVVLLLPENGSVALKGWLSAGRYPRRGRPGSSQSGRWRRIAPQAATQMLCPVPNGCSCRCGPGAVTIGILGICRDGPGALFARRAAARILDALSDQGALAIERVHLVEDIERVRRVAETDRFALALLTSISHDLKTPLASVLGAAGALRDLSKSFDDDAKAELLTTIIDESERLNRFIANLLDMTKLEIGSRGAECGVARYRRNRAAAPWSARATDFGQASGGGGDHARTCRWCRWMPCCSNRSCSISWTTLQSMHRLIRPSAFRAGGKETASAYRSSTRRWRADG